MHQSIPAAPIPPPGNCRAFACIASPRGRALAYPGALDTHMVSELKSKHRGLDNIVEVFKGFLDFMHFPIAYQPQLELSLFIH